MVPDIRAHAAKVAPIAGTSFVISWVIIVERPVDGSREPLKSTPEMKPIQAMFNALRQPLTGHQPHCILAVGQDRKIGGRPASGGAKSRANPFAGEIIEIADRSENLLGAA